MTIGILTAGPVCGFLSDRFGSRPFATAGMLGSALSFVLLDKCSQLAGRRPNGDGPHKAPRHFDQLC